jgi:hypothetical protein
MDVQPQLDSVLRFRPMSASRMLMALMFPVCIPVETHVEDANDWIADG